MAELAIVFTGGDAPGEGALDRLPDDAFVVAADGGLEHAAALGVRVGLAVGDFDSVSQSVLDAAAAAGARVQRHPVAKDQTDLELAMDAAADAGVARIVVIGGNGGRLDHWLGNVALLASSRYRAVRVEARSGASRLFVVRDRVEFSGAVGEYVSLLAWNGPASGVRTAGLRWALHGERLDAGTSRGISNELTEPEASVALSSGVLLVVLPGERAGSRG